MVRATVILLVILLTCVESVLYAFTEEELDYYEMQSFKLLRNERALRAATEGNLDFLEHLFSDFNLSVLDKEELRILRNMIFAQHGYIFKSPDLQDWFDQFEWYEPRYSDVNHMLRTVDTMNINRIKLFESAYQTDADINVTKEDMVGIWHASPMVAAGYNDLLYFFPDNHFKFAPDQMDWSQRLLGMSGTWRIEHNRLIIMIESKRMLFGGEIVEPTASCASEFAIEGGKAEDVMLDPPDIMTFPISNITTEDFEPYPQTDMERIRIGSSIWWKCSIDPYVDIQ